MMISPLNVRAEIERWPLKEPFRISGHTFVNLDCLVVTVEHRGYRGRGEAAGVYYRHDTVGSMMQQIEALVPIIGIGLSRDSLQRLLPPGGARNALDCALWDLEAQLCGQPAWQIAGLELPPRALLTTFTVGANQPEKMAADATAYTGARAIKIKLTGDPLDAARVLAIREARPDVWLGVDANQGFNLASLERLLPTLIKARVELIEQPFPIGEEALLDDLQYPIPIAADESVQGLNDLASLAGRFDVVNIKLDKCGGLTEALAIARRAHQYELEPMVGNMTGTSLAMAPGFVVGQLCRFVDLDGPVFLEQDRPARVLYERGTISCPDGLWGHPLAAEINSA